jgi:hypothetical protein
MNPDDVGKILRELGALRGDLHEMREKSDERHRLVANEVSELRAMTARAIDVANDAKRIADRSAYDTLEMQRAVIKNTAGLAAKVEAIGAVKTDIETLLAAERERKIREDALTKADDRRWKWIGRVWPIATALVGIAAYIVGHWKP